MIGKIIAIVVLALLLLYLMSFMHLLSFASAYGVFVPPAPNNLNASNFVSFLRQAFALR